MKILGVSMRGFIGIIGMEAALMGRMLSGSAAVALDAAEGGKCGERCHVVGCMLEKLINRLQYTRS